MSFCINFEWDDTQFDYPIECAAYTFADVSIFANGMNLSHNKLIYDDGSIEQRNHINMPLYYLSLWYLHHFWYICYEPFIEYYDDMENLNWKERHFIGAIGEGFIWPPITVWYKNLCELYISVNNRKRNEGIHFDNPFETFISTNDFIKEFDKLVDEVYKRLQDNKIVGDKDEDDFFELYHEVRQEREEYQHIILDEQVLVNLINERKIKN